MIIHDMLKLLHRRSNIVQKCQKFVLTRKGANFFIDTTTSTVEHLCYSIENKVF